MKPTSKLLAKSRAKRVQQTKDILEEILPTVLEAHNSQLSDEITALRETTESQITSSVQPVLDEIELIKKINIDQTKQMNTVLEELQILRQSQKNIVRERILEIYDKGKRTRLISRKQKEILDELYEDYAGMGGNSYIKRYYKRICSDWTVTPDTGEEE